MLRDACCLPNLSAIMDGSAETRAMIGDKIYSGRNRAVAQKQYVIGCLSRTENICLHTTK